MTSQPQDVSQRSFNEIDFRKLDIKLFLRSDSQGSNGEFDEDLSKYLPQSSLDELSTENTAKDGLSEMLDVPPDISSTMTFPDSQLEFVYFAESNFAQDFQKSVAFDSISGPVNEITVTTAASNADAKTNTNKVDSTEIDSAFLREFENFPLDQREAILNQAIETIDQLSLREIDQSIAQRTMSVEVEPPSNLRPRYESDGLRQIEKARTKPMIIKLPNLTDVELSSDQSFWLRLILTTYSENESDPIYLHANKLEYHSSNVVILNDGTVCVPLTLDDIKDGKKILSRLSMIKTKLEAYTRKLIPYNLSAIDGTSHGSGNKQETVSVREAKDIFIKYNMKASQISCQLLIKQNQTWYFTDITCRTYKMEQKEQKVITKKRSAKSMESDDDDEYIDKRPRTSKRNKTSNH